MLMMFCINSHKTNSFCCDRTFYEIVSLEIDSRLLFMAQNVYLKISDKKMISDIFTSFKENDSATYKLYPVANFDDRFSGGIPLSHSNIMDLHEIPEFIYFALKKRDGTNTICGPDEPIQSNSIICEVAVTGYPCKKIIPYDGYIYQDVLSLHDKDSTDVCSTLYDSLIKTLEE